MTNTAEKIVKVLNAQEKKYGSGSKEVSSFLSDVVDKYEDQIEDYEFAEDHSTCLLKFIDKSVMIRFPGEWKCFKDIWEGVGYLVSLK